MSGRSGKEEVERLASTGEHVRRWLRAPVGGTGVRSLVVITVAVILLLFGPIYHDHEHGLLIRVTYLVAVPATLVATLSLGPRPRAR